MRKWGRNLFLSGKMLNRLAGRHVRILIVQIIVFSIINCYNAVVAPFIIARVYQILEQENIIGLYVVCGAGGAMIALMFILCYLQNVYLDMNSFRISLTANQNACRLLFGLGYGRVNRQFSEGEILNRIDSCSDCISGIFPLCASVLSNVLSIGILLVIAGRFSVVLLILAVLAAGCGFLITKYESSRKVHHEEIKQQAADRAGEILEHTVSHIEFLKVYEEADCSWRIYQEERKEFWREKWKQEQAGMCAGAFMEITTSVLRGILGINLFYFYQEGKANSEGVASSFSVFDQLKGIAGAFSWPISAVRTRNLTVRRFHDLLHAGQKLQKEGKDEEDIMVSLHDVCYGVEEREILKHINLSIASGEKVAVLGANGSGKSTLMRVIAGLYQPDTGIALLNGRNIAGYSCEDLREMVSYIPAQSYLYGQTVQKNIWMNSRGKDSEERFCQVCSQSCITEKEFFGKNALELSGGQKQRVNIARGLMNPMRLLLADEPEAGLPPAQGQQVLQNILQSAETAIVITHNWDNLDIFSRILICSNGQIVEDGSSKEIMVYGNYAKQMKEQSEKGKEPT